MSSAKTTAIPATLIPGDGIGTEIVEATLQVLEALGAPFAWETRTAGMAGVKECGDPLPWMNPSVIRR
jgi:isocitrate dehydrogenase (NAD+)